MSGRAFPPLKILAPSRIASSEVSTPTAAVTPMTVTNEEPRRSRMVLNPTPVRAIVCLRKFIYVASVALPVSERFGRPQLQATPRGHGAAGDRQHDGKDQP